MLTIESSAAMARALDSAISDDLRRLLRWRFDQVCNGDLTDLAYFLIVEPGDGVPAIETALGFPLTDEGEPCFEWIMAHGSLYELTFILSDDGPAQVLLVEDRDGVAPDLLSLCRLHADSGPEEAAASQ